VFLVVPTPRTWWFSLTNGDKTILIDFDWCSGAGKGQCQVGINPDINWPSGVGPADIMEKQHDWDMLEKLRRGDAQIV
jgi:hypothetical protein